MNKTKQIKDLTWKYFLNQKCKEIILTLLIVCAVIFIPYLIGNNFSDKVGVICDGKLIGEYNVPSSILGDEQQSINECGKIGIWVQGVGKIFYYLVILAAVLLIGLFVLGMLWWWIESNWKKAKKIAKRKLKKTHKSKSKSVEGKQ